MSLYKPKTMTLRDIPEEVYNYLVTEQAKERKRLNRVVSLERIVYKLLTPKTDKKG